MPFVAFVRFFGCTRANPVRASVLAAGLLLVSLAGACEPGSPLKTACRQDTDCNDGDVCGGGVCVPGGGGDGEAGAGGDAGIVRTPAPANCNGSNWDPLQLTTIDEVRTLMIGRWAKCGGGEPVNLPSPFELADDGNWYALVRQGDGTLARSTALGKHGPYEIKSPKVLVAGAESNVAFSLEPFIMNFGPALYTVAR